MVRKIFLLLFTFMALLMFPLGVKANRIDKIDMDIYIDNEGDAYVTEVWSAYLNQGTEGYKPYYNLGNAEITNFKVSENGVTYTYKNNWSTSASFEEKAYKNGINYIDNGLELCWGISEYGYHNYTLSYEIDGFVVALDDADMIYWTLIPYDLSSKPSAVHIKIYSDFDYGMETPVWGYGNYGGTAYVYDGYIEMNSDGELDSDEYMTILVAFDKGTFNTDNVINNNFSYYKDMAEAGATHYSEESSDLGITILVVIIAFLVVIPIAIVYSVAFASGSGKKIGTKNLEFETGAKNLQKDVPHIREIPFNKDIYRTFWIAEVYKLNNKETDFLGAILLKWLMDKKITLTKTEEGMIKKKEVTAIDLTQEASFDTILEEELFNMMKTASKDGILEKNEFEKWCRNNYSKIFSWFDKVIDLVTERLVAESKISVSEKVTLKVFKSNVYTVKVDMKDEAIKLKGLKNFLEEFSRIGEKDAIEVNLWEYYLIYAQILGIADKVAKQFKKLYPEVIDNPELGYTYGDIIFINHISYSAMREASSARSRAQSYSAGGGGFSSGGGGGGSFGGGGGGGGFR